MRDKARKIITRKRVIVFFFMLSVIVLLVAVGLKKVKVNTWFVKEFSVKGVDVSHYQGDIDWKVLEKQGIEFAFIKATEGSNFVDEKFKENWDEATDTSLKIGAYHFFSFDSEGETQAENFIQTVGSLEGKLLPVIDVEYYGDKFKNPPEKTKVLVELKDMCNRLEQEYGVKPILYTTNVVYKRYLQGEFNFEEYPLWIREVYLTPDITIQDNWTFWQYSDTTVLNGYSGEEKYIDVNVFRGDEEALMTLMVDWKRKSDIGR